VPGSREGISALKARNNTLFAITGRNKTHCEQLTRNWIAKEFPGIFEDVIFANHDHSTHEKLSKSSICKQLDIKYMVDDNPTYAQDLFSENIHTFLLEKPWNSNNPFTDKNLTKISSWSYFL